MVYRADELLRLVREDHTDQVRALEDKALGFLAAVDDALDALVRRTLAAWTRTFGAPDAPGAPGAALDAVIRAVRAAVRRVTASLGRRAHTALTAALGPAVRLGAAQGAAVLRAAGARRGVAPRVRVPRELRREADRVVGLAEDQRGRALSLLGPGHVTRWSHLLRAIGAARSIGAAIRAHTAWTVGRGVNTGLTAAAETAGLGRLWVAEADACVRCLAYTGRLADDRGHFPGGLSWDPRQRHIGAAPIDGPPAHPHCRCACIPWSTRWRPRAGVPFDVALRREAHRALAYGAGRRTESRAARVRAAQELLRTEPDLLPAVEANARRAVRTGRFPVAA